MTADRAHWYLGGSALHTGIYVDLIRRLGDEGLKVGLVSRVPVSPNPLATWRAWRNRNAIGPNRIEDVRASIGGDVRQVPVWNLFPGLSASFLARALGLSRAADDTAVLHTRQIAMARLALALKRKRRTVRVIAELEGDDLAELDYKRSKTERPAMWQRLLWAFERGYYKRAEREILLGSDALICVSARLRDVMVTRFGLTPEQAARLHVIPTLASRKEFFFDAGRRERTRRELGLEDRFIVIYSGNLKGRWQVPERLVEAFAAIREVRPGAFFLVLTRAEDLGRIQPLLDRAGVAGDARVQSSPHARVVDHLCAADVGLLLRERHPMNEVAAPGKFAECVLSGLPIVMTDGIGDFSEPMRSAPLACVLPDLDAPADVRERIQRFCARDFTADQRAEFSRWGAERFAVELSTPRLAKLYRAV